VDYLDAAMTVLREEGRPLHWTVVQDLALKRGYLDPFAQRDIRRNLLAALAAGARAGAVKKEEKGVYALPEDGNAG
jgi:HB1, ASXL, restriction endonuclease HTH domain